MVHLECRGKMLRSPYHCNRNVAHKYGSFQVIFIIELQDYLLYSFRILPIIRYKIRWKTVVLNRAAISVKFALAGIIRCQIGNYGKRALSFLRGLNSNLLCPQR